MKLTRLRISNYRNIQDLDIAVNAGLVLVGPNDSGKTSVLRALHALLGTPGASLASTLSTEDFTSVAEDLVVEGWLGSFTDDDRAAFPDEIAVVDDAESLRIRLVASIDLSDPDVVSIDRSFPDSGLRKHLSLEQLRVIGWRHITASRSLYRELGGAQSGVLRSLLAGVQLGDDSERLDEAVGEFADALRALTGLDDFREQLSLALSATLPRAVDKDSLEVQLAESLVSDPLSGAQIGLVDGHSTRPLNEQSDGVRALAVLAAYSVAHSGANIIAVDEPEMHLHPAAQRSIAQVLRGSGAQVVLATHSSHVTSRFPPEEIAVFQKDTGVTQLQAGADASDYYFAARWWQDQLIQPLTAKCVVAVEGPSERMLLEAVAAQMNIALHQRSVHILELGGADNFKSAFTVFGPNGFGSRVIGLVDEDHRDAWAGIVGVEPGDLEDEGFWVCDRDLEEEVVRCLGPERIIQLLDQSGLFTEASILHVVGVARAEDATEAGLLGYMGSKKVKTRTAAALSRAIQQADAAALTKLVGVLNEAVA